MNSTKGDMMQGTVNTARFAKAGDVPVSTATQPRQVAVTIEPPVKEVPRTIDEFGVNEVMAAFRVAAKKQSVWSREALMVAVCKELGFRRMGSPMEQVLRVHLATAIQRGIVVAHVMEVSLDTKILGDYELDDLVAEVMRVMEESQEFERETVTRMVCDNFGFARITDAMRNTMTTAFDEALRNGMLGARDNVVWRLV